MTINDRIKLRRKELNLSVEDIAKAIGKDRATIYRYECSAIENMPVSIIPPLSKALDCSPAYLMGWEDNPNGVVEDETTNSAAPNKILIQGTKLTDDENDVIADYRKLNAVGKDKAKEYINDLTENEKYTENPSSKFNDKAIG